MTSNTFKLIYWTPRVLSILFLCFLALFSLDVITPGKSAQEILFGLFMHNIPVFVLSIVLVVSWKFEIVGGIVFLLAGLFYLFHMIFLSNRSSFEMHDIGALFIIAGPVCMISVFFFINWYLKIKHK